MRPSLSLMFALAFAAPAHAASLDLSGARIIATFEEYNLTTNLTAQNGKLLIPDSQRDVLMVRGIADATSYDVPLSVERANFIMPLEGTKVAISDPSFDKITIIDYAARREVSTYTYTDHFGPWHMAYANGVIYGANKGDRLITRYNPNARRALSDYVGGSGPAFLVAANGLLYVDEQGAPGTPGDDRVAWYDTTSGQLKGRLALDGSSNEMIGFGDGVCITLSFSDKVQCGRPDTNTWQEAPGGIDPWGMAVGHGQLWVMSRGEPDQQVPMVITYGMVDGTLTRLAAWKLRGLPNLDLPRSLAYDSQTKTLLVRGIRSVYAIPVVD